MQQTKQAQQNSSSNHCSFSVFFQAWVVVLGKSSPWSALNFWTEPRLCLYDIFSFPISQISNSQLKVPFYLFRRFVTEHNSSLYLKLHVLYFRFIVIIICELNLFKHCLFYAVFFMYEMHECMCESYKHYIYLYLCRNEIPNTIKICTISLSFFFL